jgi:hypothetical protein
MQEASTCGADCRLQHQGPTSHEVGMQECEPTDCRLQHQGPTSHEVGMQECEPTARSVGWSISDPPLTRWVCRNASLRRGL